MMKKIPISRIIASFLFVIIAIFGIAFLIQYFVEGTNLFNTLGFLFSSKCSASLSLSSPKSDCLMKAKILANDCEGKKYQIREGSCFGNVKCEGSIDYESFQAGCSWMNKHGNYNFVLCINGIQKDSAKMSC